MATAIKDAKATDYRVTLRHIPFRLKSKVFEASGPAEAWSLFLDALRQENKNLPAAARKVVGPQQTLWLSERDQRPNEPPPHCDIVLESDHQERLQESKNREDASRKLVYQNQVALKQMAESSQVTSQNLAQLIAQMPQNLAQAMADAIGKVLAQQGNRPKGS